MSLFTKISLRIGLCVLVGFALPLGTAGTVDDAQSFALQASEPYVKEGFQVREDYWGGDLGSGDSKSDGKLFHHRGGRGIAGRTDTLGAGLRVPLIDVPARLGLDLRSG